MSGEAEQEDTAGKLGASQLYPASNQNQNTHVTTDEDFPEPLVRVKVSKRLYRLLCTYVVFVVSIFVLSGYRGQFAVNRYNQGPHGSGITLPLNQTPVTPVGGMNHTHKHNGRSK